MAFSQSFKHCLRYVCSPLSVASLRQSATHRVYSLQRCFSGSPLLYSGSSQDDLERAKQRVTTLTEDPGNEAKLKLYALYKQVGATLIMLLAFNLFVQVSGYHM